MSTRPRSSMGGRGVGVLAVAIGLATGAFAQTALRRDRPVDARAEWETFRREHSDSVYALATRGFGGTLVKGNGGPLATDRVVLVVLRGPDLVTCEDLGRQLRDLERAVPRDRRWSFSIVIDPRGERTLRSFLARERIYRPAIVVGDPDHLVAGQARLSTPAALVAGRDGQVLAGVSHPLRVRDTRTRSFAQELGMPGR